MQAEVVLIKESSNWRARCVLLGWGEHHIRCPWNVPKDSCCPVMPVWGDSCPRSDIYLPTIEHGWYRTRFRDIKWDWYHWIWRFLVYYEQFLAWKSSVSENTWQVARFSADLWYCSLASAASWYWATSSHIRGRTTQLDEFSCKF